MKIINLITAAIILMLFVVGLINIPVTQKYEIHKTRSGDFIIIDGKNGASRIYELVELPTNRVSEAFK
jgi:hypothetical protein